MWNGTRYSFIYKFQHTRENFVGTQSIGVKNYCILCRA